MRHWQPAESRRLPGGSLEWVDSGEDSDEDSDEDPGEDPDEDAGELLDRSRGPLEARLIDAEDGLTPSSEAITRHGGHREDQGVERERSVGWRV